MQEHQESHSDYSGAGVLPWALSPVTGRPALLLHEASATSAKRGRLVEWGGHREPSDASAACTAARELLEETGGLLAVAPGALEGSPAFANGRGYVLFLHRLGWEDVAQGPVPGPKRRVATWVPLELALDPRCCPPLFERITSCTGLVEALRALL
eukprot:m51a1_g3622 hypothetical protein (155) ;mRNA; f:97200-97732